nr:hypothetical protein [Rugamonas fusca]
MPYREILRLSSIGLSVVLCSAPVLAQQGGAVGPDERPAGVTLAELQARLWDMQQQLAEQKAQLQALRRQLGQQRGAADDDGQGGAASAPPAVSASRLATQRGTGAGTGIGGGAATGGVVGAGTGAGAGSGLAAASSPAAGAAADSRPVGEAPPGAGRPPEVAPLFEQPGVLTAKGHYVLEPSLQFGYSSSNRVALVGYTIIPALLIGLVDIRELKRNTVTATLTGRYGVGPRTELELKVPYVYRSDSTVSREILTGTGVDRAFDTSGKALGDIELALRHQFRRSATSSAAAPPARLITWAACA